MTTIRFVVVVLMFFSNGGGDFKDCGFNEKFEDGQCKPCPKCSVGFGLSSECGAGLGEGMKCQPCPQHTYNHRHGERKCLPCTNCTIYNRKVIYRCRPQVDAECGSCLNGFYDAHKNLGLFGKMPCKSCGHNPSHPDCELWQMQIVPPSTTYFKAAESSEKVPNGHIGSTVAAIITGSAFLLLLPAFIYVLLSYKRMKRWRPGGEGYGCNIQRNNRTVSSDIEGTTTTLQHLDSNKITLCRNDNYDGIAQPKASTSGMKFLQPKGKPKMKKPKTDFLQGRGKVVPVEEIDSAASQVAVKDSSSSSCDSPLSSCSDAENEDTDITFSDSMSLLEAQRLKSKCSSMKTNSPKAQSSPPSSSVNLNDDGTVKYNRTRKSLPLYHRSVSDQDSLPGATADSVTIETSEKTGLLCANEIPQADVQRTTNSTVPTPSAPPASYTDNGDIHEMETLMIRPCDVDDVASLANHQSLATGYSDATTVPVRSLCPVDGVSDLLSLDTMSDNVLFPALIAESKPNQNNLSKSGPGNNIPRTSNRGGDVDTCPNFGLRVPNIHNEAADWVNFDDDDFLRPPPAPSMDHIRQLLRYELPIPSRGSWNNAAQDNTGPHTDDDSTQDTELKRPVCPRLMEQNESPRRCGNWNDTERELFDAESDAEVLYKMAKTLDGERYARALRVAAEKQISDLNYEVQEQISLALNCRGIAGDRNYIHLALRLGINENVIDNLAGMMDVLKHLKMRRVTIGELLRTLRVMERLDVVNMLSGAILDSADCFAQPGRDTNDDDDEDVITTPEQEQGSVISKEYPYPVQECMA